jgi:hypothetical protein
MITSDDIWQQLPDDNPDDNANWQQLHLTTQMTPPDNNPKVNPDDNSRWHIQMSVGVVI